MSLLHVIIVIAFLINIGIALIEKNSHSVAGWLCATAFALVVIIESRIGELAK